MILFPLYFKNNHNHYPPIYYDFYSENGYYPNSEFLDICLERYMNSYRKNISLTQCKSRHKSQCQYLEMGLDFFADDIYKAIINKI